MRRLRMSRPRWSVPRRYSDHPPATSAAAAGPSADTARDNGPGSFSGPYVDGTQALLVLALELAVFVAIAAALLRRQDVS